MIFFDFLDALRHRRAFRNFHQPGLFQDRLRHRRAVLAEIKRDVLQVRLVRRRIGQIHDGDQAGAGGGLSISASSFGRVCAGELKSMISGIGSETSGGRPATDLVPFSDR